MAYSGGPIANGSKAIGVIKTAPESFLLFAGSIESAMQSIAFRAKEQE